MWTPKLCRLKQHLSKDQASSIVPWEHQLPPQQPGDMFNPDMEIRSDEDLEDPGKGDMV